MMKRFFKLHGRLGGGEGLGGFGGHHGGRRERLFESGHIKLLVLHILGQQPAHGYEVIRAIGDLVGGDYSPSPGTIYPTLTYLEDTGHASSTVLEGGRKQYSITAEGEAYLATQQEPVERLLSRLTHGRSHAKARRSPEIQRAVENLKTALRLRFEESAPDAEVVRRIADIIDRAAVDIGRA